MWFERNCVDPIANDVFEGFFTVDDSGSFGGSGDDLHGDSCGFTECVLAVSSGVLARQKVETNSGS